MDKRSIAREVIRLRVQQMVVNEWYKAGRFKIPIHLGFGHEALAVAVSAVMGRGDWLFLTHRNIAYNLGREKSLKPFLDEYSLKPTGVAGGRFGSMNLIHPSRGILYTSSILANQFPVAVGSAFGFTVSDANGIAIVCGGDGAIEEGAFYESVLMAASIKAPILFLIENNEWSMHTSIRERRVDIDLKKLASSLGVLYVSLKGNNVFAYIQALARARKQILTSRAPLCIEVKVNTLGDWYDMKNPLYPQGKFVKYHTGASPSVMLSEEVVLQKNADDPLFVLGKLISEASVKKMAVQELAHIRKEMI
ncbi:MAG: Pyruvate/2-oxoglutarate dehydrogenase complex,dehydrogenase (E1) component, alpha subunit [Parcubacteria group bacterium Gr01-1014_17]|nr:MAG: Pyruvate/2-oxoglutarate dehydrogenase complex,dehydrogenase (E1) component, alpha subunit [Parcubacteria group bacterium Gr01-1014_17]